MFHRRPPNVRRGSAIKERYRSVPFAPNFYCWARDGEPTAYTRQTPDLARFGEIWRHLAVNDRVESSRPSNRTLNLAVIAEMITADLREIS